MKKEGIFTRHADGRITIDKWPEYILIAKALMDDAYGPYVWRRGNEVHCYASNGQAVYDIIEYDGETDSFHLTLQKQSLAEDHSADFALWEAELN